MFFTKIGNRYNFIKYHIGCLLIFVKEYPPEKENRMEGGLFM